MAYTNQDRIKVLKALSQGMTIQAASTKHKVATDTISRWKREARTAGGRAAAPIKRAVDKKLGSRSVIRGSRSELLALRKENLRLMTKLQEMTVNVLIPQLFTRLGLPTPDMAIIESKKKAA